MTTPVNKLAAVAEDLIMREEFSKVVVTLPDGSKLDGGRTSWEKGLGEIFRVLQVGQSGVSCPP